MIITLSLPYPVFGRLGWSARSARRASQDLDALVSFPRHHEHPSSPTSARVASTGASVRFASRPLPPSATLLVLSLLVFEGC